MALMNGHGGDAGGISVTRLGVPFLLVLALGVFLIGAGYQFGGVMAQIKTTEARLDNIERDMASIKGLLDGRCKK